MIIPGHFTYGDHITQETYCHTPYILYRPGRCVLAHIILVFNTQDWAYSLFGTTDFNDSTSIENNDMVIVTTKLYPFSYTYSLHFFDCILEEMGFTSTVTFIRRRKDLFLYDLKGVTGHCICS